MYYIQIWRRCVVHRHLRIGDEKKKWTNKHGYEKKKNQNNKKRLEKLIAFHFSYVFLCASVCVSTSYTCVRNIYSVQLGHVCASNFSASFLHIYTQNFHMCLFGCGLGIWVLWWSNIVGGRQGVFDKYI